MVVAGVVMAIPILIWGILTLVLTLILTAEILILILMVAVMIRLRQAAGTEESTRYSLARSSLRPSWHRSDVSANESGASEPPLREMQTRTRQQMRTR